MFTQAFGCLLPWMNPIEFGNSTELCPIFGHPNGTYNDLINKWEKFRESKTVQSSCKFQSPCIKSIYSKSIESWVNGPQPAAYGGNLQIQFATQDVQEIEDHISYDTQSFIGEVGGTLGLLLGLSFISIFDLFEWVLANYQEKK